MFFQPGAETDCGNGSMRFPTSWEGCHNDAQLEYMVDTVLHESLHVMDYLTLGTAYCKWHARGSTDKEGGWFDEEAARINQQYSVGRRALALIKENCKCECGR